GTADQKLPLMPMLRTGAADKGVQRGNTVHQTLLKEEVQRPVYGGRRSAAVIFAGQGLEKIVGTERLVALPDQFKHAFAQHGKAYPCPGAQLFGSVQRLADTLAVVVRVMGIDLDECVRH